MSLWFLLSVVFAQSDNHMDSMAKPQKQADEFNAQSQTATIEKKQLNSPRQLCSVKFGVTFQVAM